MKSIRTALGPGGRWAAWAWANPAERKPLGIWPWLSLIAPLLGYSAVQPHREMKLVPPGPSNIGSIYMPLAKLVQL